MATATEPEIPQGIDPQLVGHWRHTTGQSSGGFSMTTDTHYVLNADGSFAWRSRTVGSAGESSDGPEYGYWRAGNGRIYLQFAGGEVSSTAYQVSHDGLLLPEEAEQRYWQRIE